MILLLIAKVYSQTLYETLEVDQYASQELIKRNFRKLSTKYHPDRNPGNQELRLRFLAINRAFQVLSDVSKRNTYDLQGQQGLLDYQKGKRKPKGGDFRTQTSVKLQDFYNGAQQVYSFRRGQICKKCKGTGDATGKIGVCPQCSGLGSVNRMVNMGGKRMQIPVLCNVCQGSGKGGKGNCPQCRGQKITMRPRDLPYIVQKGMKDGQIIVFKGQSQQTIQTYPGDVYLKLRQIPHGTFKRVGDNLYVDLEINLQEAILGFSRTIKHLDGRQVLVQSGEISQDGREIVLKGEGMPIKNDSTRFGNLHVRIKVKFPSFNKEQLEQIRKIYEQ